MNYRIFQLILINKKNWLSWYVTKNTLLYNYEKRLRKEVATDLFIKKKKCLWERLDHWSHMAVRGNLIKFYKWLAIGKHWIA